MDDSETYMNVKFSKTRSSSRSPHKQEPNENFGDGPDRRICILCLVTSVLFVTVVGLSIYVSQIHQSLKRMHIDLHHQFTDMETKYRSINETKAQICKFLIGRRETTCPQEWIKNEDRCYFISTFGTFYDGARQNCSELDSRPLEINLNKEKKFVSKAVERYVTYWIGKCADRNVASDLVYELSYETPTCIKCGSSYRYSCKSKFRFICEKTAYLYPDIPEEVQGLCQLPFEPNSIK
ncbi:C-type lectin domain family 12 member A-like [Hypanus sabinus]|uniref:C-type lectin domain family 12 member A-like n=1 Tax=Hypanus sabinus TaxID=79690 RepID=UPI0028C4B771|nr:C-type lectin domain family 12 member A-like [Hypanus sabinus]